METSQDKEFRITPSLKREIIKIVDERIKEAHVTREDFTELKNIVKDLAEAQKRTEQRVEELAEAQKRTEERLTQLTIRVNELAEAQKRTEEELRLLIKEHERTREILSGISDTVGHGLEDKIFPYLYDFARKEYGVEVEVVDRRNVLYTDGRFDEVNIYVEGRRDGERVYIVGECKSRPSIKEVDNFWRLIERLREHFKAKVYPFVVGYTYSPSVEEYLRTKYPEIRVLKSFEFELKYKPTTLLT
jgi:hypothetical protein